MNTKIDLTVVEGWYNKLQNDNAGRAELKRSSNLFDVLLQKQYHILRSNLNYEKPVEIVTCIAGLCSHVKNNTAVPLILGLARGKSGSNRPIYSEMKLKKYASVSDWEEFYTLTVRAIHMLDCAVSVESIVDLVVRFYYTMKSNSISNKYNFRVYVSEQYYTEVLD